MPRKSRYKTNFLRAVRERLHSAHAETQPVSDLMNYPAAVKMAGERLFGSHWVGPAEDQTERATLDYGPGHPDYTDALHQYRRREAQIEHAENWLRDLVQTVNGSRYVSRSELEKALILRFGPPAAASAGPEKLSEAVAARAPSNTPQRKPAQEAVMRALEARYVTPQGL